MGEIKLYPYQEKFVNAIQSSFNKFKHIMGVMPCGGGKSYCIAEIAKRATNKGSRVLILSHRLVLLRQNNESIFEYGLEQMIVLNDEKKDNVDFSQKLFCSSLQTLQSRMKEQEYCDFISSCDLILIDESHLLFSNFLFESGLVDNTYMIGFSGSPRRVGSQRQMGLDWDQIVDSISVKELIAMKRLVPMRYFVVPDDISGIKVDNSTGDFQAKSAYKHFDSPAKYSNCVEQYQKHGENRQFICFCTNIAHTIKTTVELNKVGIRTVYTISNILEPKEPIVKEGVVWERYLDALEVWHLHQQYNKYSIHQTKIKELLESGRINGVCCISILTIGFDYKPLGCVIVNKATQSLPLIIQIFGRGIRWSKGKKDCICLDMGTNVQRLGKSEDDFKWSLWHETSDSVGIPAMKECDPLKKDSKGKNGCGRLVLSSANICKCGHRFESHPSEKRAELIEIINEEPTSFKEMSVQGLVAYAELHLYKRPWIFRQLYLRGESEFKLGMRELNYDYKFIYRTLQMYKKKQ